jgi:hypothetical protein
VPFPGKFQGIGPFLPVEVATAQPHHCCYLDHLILIEGIDRILQFSQGGIIGVVFQYRAHAVVARVGAGIEIHRLDLGVEFTRLDDDVAKLLRTDAQIWKRWFLNDRHSRLPSE